MKITKISEFRAVHLAYNVFIDNINFSVNYMKTRGNRRNSETLFVSRTYGKDRIEQIEKIIGCSINNDIRNTAFGIRILKEIRENVRLQEIP